MHQTNIETGLLHLHKNTATRNFLAIDLGSEECRVLLATAGSESLQMECLHRFATPLIEIYRGLYWNIYTVYQEIVRGLSLAGNRGINVESIGVNAWGADIVGISKDGTLCGLPRSFRDPFTQGMPARFFKKMPQEELYRRTGVHNSEGNAVFQLYAMHREKASVLDNAKQLLFLPDAISYLLTGQKYCECSILSSSGLMDPDRKKIDKHVLGVCKVKKSRFPSSVVMPGKKIGRLNADLGIRTGLGQVPVIAVAGHGTACSIAAIPASDKGFAYIHRGAKTIMGTECSQPVITENTARWGFTNETGAFGTVAIYKTIGGSSLLEQCLLKWKREDKDYSLREAAEMAASCPESEVVIDVEDPTLASASDTPAAICAYCRAHGIPEPEDDARMIRLIYDSTAAIYASAFDEIRAVSPEPVKALHMIGAAATDSLLAQLTANACNIPVITGPAECTAVGNVMIQARAAGMFSGLQEMRDYIRRNVTTQLYTPSL